MMSFCRTAVVALTLFAIPFSLAGQAPDLGTTSSFAMFTAVGAFNNLGATHVTGDIGTNVGAFAGFPPGVVIGGIHVADPESAQAAIDVEVAYDALDGLNCGLVINSTLGNGQSLTPNIYCIGEASVLNGNLTLDAQGDPDGLFIFQIDGAFSTATFASITLVGGASLCNVYWQVNGAFALGDFSFFQGTIIASGQISLLEGSSLLGRGLTTAGAINMHNNNVQAETPPEPATIIADGPTSFCQGDSVVLSGNCCGEWNNGDSTSNITVTESGVYFVTTTNICGIAVSNQITITVHPLPTCSISGNFTICDGQPTELCANPDMTTYLWSTGETSDCITTTTSGDYSVTITDENGCTSTCSQNVANMDFFPPDISCPTNVTIACDEDTLPANTGTASAVDDCDPSPTVNFTDTFTAGACDQVYTITRTWTALDVSGNSATCIQVISIQDDASPGITCPPDVNAVCTISTDPAVTGSATATDQCDTAPVITFLDDVVEGSCPIILLRTWIATDDCGNTATCIQTITISDDTPPQITCAPVVSPMACGTTPVFGAPSVSDDCDNDVLVTFTTETIEGNCGQTYTLIRTWTATDDCGNTATCSATISFEDITPPVINCPGDVSEIACGTPLVFATPTATDACDPLVDITFTDVTVSGFCTQEYSITRTWIATDDCGNTATCSSTIAIQDNTPPVLTCPAVVSPMACGSVVAFGDASATDVCDNAVEVTFTDMTVQGACLQTYSVTRTWIATDDCGNTSTCSRTIEVQDFTAPLITCPVVVSPIACGATPVFGTATASDACDTSVDIGFSDVTIPGLCPAEYTITRTWIATDDCGNTASCSATIIVGGNSVLSMSCPADLNVTCAADVPAVDITLITFSGNCGAVTVTHLNDDFSNQSCLNSFVLTRTYQASDACGQTAICSQIITILDTIRPAITFLQPLPQQSGDTVLTQCYGQDPEWNIPTYHSGSVMATDNCADEVIITYDISLEDEGDCTADGYINLYKMTWTATDVCGNSSTAHLYLALVDTIAPVIEGVPDNITVNCESVPEPPATYATDECLCACVVLFEETERDFSTCQNGVVIIRTWTARDRCGNTTVETQQITVIDEEAPVLAFTHPELTAYSDGIVLEYTCHEGGIPAFYDTLDTDDVMIHGMCDAGAVITFTENSIIQTNCDYFGYLEQRIYKWAATDACGNQTMLTIAVRLIDNEAPVIADLPEMVCIGDPVLNDIEVYDNCDDASLRYWDVNIPNPCGEGLATRRTYEAYDACGNITVDTVILLPVTQDALAIIFVNPLLVNLETSHGISFNCEALGHRYTTFSSKDVQVEGVCGEGSTIDFTETLLSTNDCHPGGFIATIELRWTATDVCGSFVERVIIAEIMDDSAPLFVGFKPELSIGCGVPIPDVVATDNCGDVVITYTDSIHQGVCEFSYDLFRLIEATDLCGNVATRHQIIHVGNDNGPVITGVEDFICDDLSIPDVTAYDACTGEFVNVTMHQDTVPSECHDGLVIIRTWSATHACGQVTTIHQTIVINDITPPEILIPAYSVIRQFVDQSYNMVYHSQTTLLARINAIEAYHVFVKDDCDQHIVPVLTVDTLYAEDCLTEGYAQRRTYTWTATDVCGNTATLTFTVDIVDDLEPTFTILEYDTVIICAPLPPAPEMLLTDTIENVTILFTETHEFIPELGQTAVVRTWVATDPCENSSIYEQHIIWQPESTLECVINFPEVVECNSHGVVITSDVVGGVGPYVYEWEVVGEKCFIQGGQGTPEIMIYMGWADVKIILTITDAYGCVSMCMVLLECVDVNASSLSNPYEMIQSEDGKEQSVPTTSNANRSTADDHGQLSLWPNPADELINIAFESGVDGFVNLILVNFLGQDIRNEQVKVQKGSNVIEFNATSLANGSYVVKLQSEHMQYTKGVLILHKE